MMAEHAEPQVKTNVLRLLEGAAIPFRWFEYDVSDGKIDAVSISAKINEPPDQVFKTLVAQGPKRDHFVFVIPAPASLDLKKAARAAGQKSISGDVQRLLQDDPPIKPLTPRQAEILSYVTRGLTNQDIAKVLGIRVDSVAQNLSAIFAKLNAANRAEAITIALRKHLLKL